MTEDIAVTREAAAAALAGIARAVDGRSETARALRLLERVATQDEAGALRALLLEAGAVAVVRAARP